MLKALPIVLCMFMTGIYAGIMTDVIRGEVVPTEGTRILLLVLLNWWLTVAIVLFAYFLKKGNN